MDLNYQYKDYSKLIIPEGFLEHNGNVRFYQNWRMQRGWVSYNDTRYYLDEAGNLVRGWFSDPSGTYYLSPADGSIARGQCQVDGADFYFTAEGVKTSGWVVLNEQKFFYDPANNGIMKREWLSDEKGNIYFFDRADGHMLTGAQVIDNAEFLFNAEGIRQQGWVSLENGTFYYDPATGAKVKGFFDDAKGRHYLAPDDGHMVTGPVTVDKQDYFFNAEGVMAVGVVDRGDGIFYYDPATGALVRNGTLEIDGAAYTTTPDGVLVKVEAPAPEGEAAPQEGQN